MEKAVSVYSKKDISDYIRDAKENGICEHGFARLAADLTILISNGRLENSRSDAEEMMTLCCEQLPAVPPVFRGNWVGNDFAVKELVFALLEAERSGAFKKELTEMWRNGLARLVPERSYNSIPDTPHTRVANWSAYGAASEQLRAYAGLADEKDFIELEIGSQIRHFDKNGMYRDPGEPMLYDIVTRLQLIIALEYGYSGKYRAELERLLSLSREMTLKMQSVSGEIPFGGRSAQFLYNEAAFASLCEAEAVRCKREGKLVLAGQFRNAARLAAESVESWLSVPRIRHIKNRMSKKSKFGCEGYGYFNKYMVTLASMIYPAYLLADETIPLRACPAVKGGFCAETGADFHKLFINGGGYFLQLELSADPCYDASGLGRIHKKGVPSPLMLSVPFAKRPHYNIGKQNPSFLSIAPIYVSGNKMLSGASPDTRYSVCRTDGSTAFLTCDIKGCPSLLWWDISASRNGVGLRLSGEGTVGFTVPVFMSDGYENTEVSCDGHSLTVTYRGAKAVYTSNGTFTAPSGEWRNRNGAYAACTVTAEGELTLDITAKAAK